MIIYIANMIVMCMYLIVKSLKIFFKYKIIFIDPEPVKRECYCCVFYEYGSFVVCIKGAVTMNNSPY